ENEQRGGRRGVGSVREAALLLDDDHHEYVGGEGDGNVEEAEESAILVSSRRRRLDANDGEEDDGDGCGEPCDEQQDGLGVVPAVDGEVELREDGAAEADVALEQAQHDPAAAPWKALDAGDERAGAGQGLRVGPSADVGAHEPERRARRPAGDDEVDHEVAGEVHGGADGEHGRGWRDLVQEAGDDADVAAEVLEEGERVERALVVAQRRLERRGVDAEGVGRPRRGQDEQARERHEPPPCHHLSGEPQCHHLRLRHARATAVHHN
uniref:Uncharacterized protein n=1 Tax=Triticum urartu TaxID=4572 RepID=A0A8R7Q1Z5_TRIUA